MAVSFDDARKIVEADEAPRWPPDAGTYMVADWGYEDAQAWWVLSGAREDLVDGDPDYMPMDAAIPLVSKTTGVIERVTYLEESDRLEAMSQVGDHAPQ